MLGTGHTVARVKLVLREAMRAFCVPFLLGPSESGTAYSSFTHGVPYPLFLRTLPRTGCGLDTLVNFGNLADER